MSNHLIKDEFVESDTISIALVKPPKIDYEHVRCNCGGVIATWDRKTFTCDICAKEFELYRLTYDRVYMNDRTGWMFPVRLKEDEE